jgi:dUTP pyrophosphatase
MTEHEAAEPPVVRVKLLREGARLPFRATEASSGFDLYACLGAAQVVVTQTPIQIPTGLALAVPEGLDAQIRPRSGLARQGVLSTFGTLDADYRGELMVALYTTSPKVSYTVRDGDRIAQMVITQLAPVSFTLAETLDDTSRGAGGHGSTGR